MTCPCGLGEPYDDCCGRFHRGEASAPTAELLMRSRFAAFGLGDEAYLLRTWHPETRPRHVRFDPEQRWTRPQILDRTGVACSTRRGRSGSGPGTRTGCPDVMEENSAFARHDGQWVYPAPSAR